MQHSDYAIPLERFPAFGVNGSIGVRLSSLTAAGRNIH
jgi:hypothetical protein